MYIPKKRPPFEVLHQPQQTSTKIKKEEIIQILKEIQASEPEYLLNKTLNEKLERIQTNMDKNIDETLKELKAIRQLLEEQKLSKTPKEEPTIGDELPGIGRIIYETIVEDMVSFKLIARRVLVRGTVFILGYGAAINISGGTLSGDVHADLEVFSELFKQIVNRDPKLSQNTFDWSYHVCLRFAAFLNSVSWVIAHQSEIQVTFYDDILFEDKISLGVNIKDLQNLGNIESIQKIQVLSQKQTKI